MTDQPLPPGSRVLLYVRVSPRDANEDGALSIESQIAELRAAAAGWGWTVASVYVDQLESGASDDRPAFQELIAYCQRHRADVDGVLVWRFSRFARDDVDAMYYKSLLARWNVRVVSFSEPMPDLGGWERIIERVIEVQDAQQLRQIREDIKRAQRHLVRQGYRIGGPVPKGYVAQAVARGMNPAGETRYNSILAPDPARAPDVHGAFQMLVQGASYREINSRYGLVKNHHNLAYTFRNPVYIGWAVCGRRSGEMTVNETAHEPLIPRSLWDQAQELLASRRAPAARAIRNTSRGSYLLSGLATCGLCGSRLSGSCQVQNGREYRYYRCSRRYHEHWHACTLPNLRQELVEGTVLAAIRAEILTPARLRDLVDRVNAELAATQPDDFQERRRALQQQLREVESRLGNVLAAIETLGVRAGDVATRLAELTDSQARVERELADLAVAERAARPLAVSDTDIAALAQDLAGTLADAPMPARRAALRSFVEQVVVYPERVRIVYRSPAHREAGPAARGGRFEGEWELGASLLAGQ